MGINFGSLIPSKEINLEELEGRIVAVDAFNWLYQFLAIIRGADGQPLQDSKGRVTSHLSGLFYRNVNLLEAGVRPVYVFDGPPPAFKHVETARRKEVREAAAKEWKEALAAGRIEEARKAAMRSTTLTSEMIDDAKHLLSAMGVPVVQAPSDGEALATSMVSAGHAWVVATQDYDALLFGAPRMVRNLSISGRRKYLKKEYVMVNPEMIVLKDALAELGITRDQLIILGMLIGTDYNPGGVPGYGPKKSMDVVKEKKTLSSVLEETGWPFEFDPEEIFNLYKSPPESKEKPAFGKPDEEKIRKMLVDEHEFSPERIASALERIGEREKKERKQPGLHGFA